MKIGTHRSARLQHAKGKKPTGERHLYLHFQKPAQRYDDWSVLKQTHYDLISIHEMQIQYIKVIDKSLLFFLSTPNQSSIFLLIFMLNEMLNPPEYGRKEWLDDMRRLLPMVCFSS